METNFQKLLLEEISRLFEPLVTAARSVGYRRALFGEVGWNLAALPGVEAGLTQKLEMLVEAHATISTLINDPPESLPELKAAFAALKPLIAAAKSLKTAFNEVAAVAPYLDDLLEELLHQLLLIYLQRWRPLLYQAADLLTLIEVSPTFEPPQQVKNGEGQVIIAQHHPRRVRFDRLGLLFSDPAKALGDHYLPNGLATKADVATASGLIFPMLARVLEEIGMRAVYGVAPGAEVDLGEADPELIRRLFFVSTRAPVGPSVGLGASLLMLSKEEGGPGLAVSPRGTASFNTKLSGWELDLTTEGTPGTFVVGPQGVAMANDGAGLKVAARLRKTRYDDEEAPLLIGSVKGTRLEANHVSVGAGFSVGSGEDPDISISAEAREAALVLCAGDGDGFLQKVLPEEIRVPFALGVEWSRAGGLRLKGGAGLETNLAIRKSFGGVLDIDTLHFGARADETGLSAQASVSAKAHIGPITAVVEQIGVEARLTPTPAGEVGALGPLDLDISFKPPAGVGLDIKAGPVTGGGYLFFDAAKAQYAGALQLELGGKIALGAVGLLTTRMPDGDKGFSLFVLISAEFPPMQLGYGFTLNGVGGLIGVNRTANTDVLRAGIRTGGLGSVLFPKDPARNAPQIISNLNAAFPAAADRVLVGPMAKLGWGTPRILTLDLGLVLEMPAPVRLLLLGRLRAILPSEDKPLVRLQMDALGVLDLERREVSLDATLYDSKLLEFALTGDMALRASWGANPNFLLGVGGFNPRYRPPAAFPKLNRVALSLDQGSNLKLRLETYLALTSNTAQFGARADLNVSAAGFTVDAYLYFDALFQFEPFAFVVDLGAMAALKYKGRNLVGVKFDMNLSGPSPWHVRGKAKIEVLFFDVTVDFDHTFGRRQAPATPAVTYVRPLLLEALRDPRSWSGLTVGHPLVRLRDPGTAETELLLHPLAALSVSQRVAPLDQYITRFGATAPGDGGRYTLEMVAPDGGSLDGRVEVTPVRDAFAPAQFRAMSDAEKLGAPAFEQMQSGLSLAAHAVEAPYDPALDLDVSFETAVYRAPQGGADQRIAAAPLSGRLMEAAADAGAAAKARGRLSSALTATA